MAENTLQTSLVTNGATPDLLQALMACPYQQLGQLIAQLTGKNSFDMFCKHQRNTVSVFPLCMLEGEKTSVKIKYI